MPKPLIGWASSHQPQTHDFHRSSPYIEIDGCNHDSKVVKPNFWKSRKEEQQAEQGNLVLDGVVPVRKVLKGGSTIVGSIAFMSLVLKATSGELVIDPLISLILLVGAVAFYLMSLAKE